MDSTEQFQGPSRFEEKQNGKGKELSRVFFWQHSRHVEVPKNGPGLQVTLEHNMKRLKAPHGLLVVPRSPKGS